MVGEIRDQETAEIAIHASLTGHLVLSHDPHQRRGRRRHAPGRDGGRAVPRALVASSAMLAQRLVRVLCPSCKEPYTADAVRARAARHRSGAHARGATTRQLSPRYVAARRRRTIAGRARAEPGTAHVLPRRRAATTARRQGFTGRRGIYELLVIDDAVGALILKSADAQTHQARRDRAGHGHAARRRRAQGARGHDHASKRSLAATQDDVVDRRVRGSAWPSSSTAASRSRPARRSRASATPTTPKALRAALRARGHPAHAGDRGEAAARRRRKRDIDLFAFFSRVSRGRRRDDDAPARDAGRAPASRSSSRSAR